MSILIACLIIFEFGLPGWLYCLVAMVGVMEFLIKNQYMEQTFQKCLGEFAKKAAEYNAEQDKK